MTMTRARALRPDTDAVRRRDLFGRRLVTFHTQALFASAPIMDPAQRLERAPITSPSFGQIAPRHAVACHLFTAA
jgi:hypothetical protein